MKASIIRFGLLASAVASTLALSACNLDSILGKATATPGDKAETAVKANSNAVLASVNGINITEMDIAAMVSGGLDKANAVDRAINREVAASMARRDYNDDVKNAVAAAEREIAANIYATKQMKKQLDGISEDDIKHRYDTLVKDADFNGYKLVFALFASAEDAKTAVEQAKAGKGDALKVFQPVVAGKSGETLFISRNDVPYNLGVFVAKLKEGEFTEPALVRNGYIVLQAKEIKSNPKPALDAVKDSLRASIADERLAKSLAEARKSASVSLK